ncbi:APC family permease [Streptococcus merionis]|uniref:APC family permease n=1 Tax=Streptococcus merionis TaxID=400065 RepID=UPI0026ECB3F7|nr:APC family permease [Streptococcus merionis]
MKHVTQKQTYNLWTAIAMIVGIVIGSGIYFKADDILNFTGGHVGLGMLVITLGSLSVTFGSLSLSELAQRNTESGGLSSYFEDYIHPSLAATLGMFAAYLYFPTVIAVVAWVAALYTFILLGMTVSLGTQVLLGMVYVVLIAAINIFSRVLGGYFQTLSTTIKIIPLIVIGLVGIFWASAQPTIPAQFETVLPRDVGWGWMAGLVPLAFAFDGWTAVTGIAPEIKDPKKNLPRAFIIGPMLILALYLLFFYGMTRILGSSFIMSTGNEAVTYAGVTIFGPWIGKLLLFIVIISVLGVVNGMLLATMRLPQAFAARNWIKSEKMAKIDLKYQLSIPAALSVTGVVLFYLIVHYVVQSQGLLPGTDISEITIVFNNFSINLLHVVVLRLFAKGEITNRLTGLVAPVIAMAGSLMIFVGSFINNPIMVGFFQLFCVVFCLVSYSIYKKNTQ